MMDDPITKLAEYFSGPCVALHSIGLALSGPTKLAADQYYAARQAMGVHGYASKDEARLAIIRTLESTGHWQS